MATIHPVTLLAVGVLVCAWVAWAAPAAQGWAGEHHLITRVAVEALSPEEQTFLAPEKEALVNMYCAFPDTNWPNNGQWGGGDGDPRQPRLPDTRREWEVSYYCAWDPVLREGTPYNHAPPASVEATGVHFRRSVEAFGDGRYEDGVRIMGAMMHYIQDTGSYPHMQPFHRGIQVKDWDAVSLAGYEPRLLAEDLEAACARASDRVEQVRVHTERQLAPVLEGTEVSVEKATEMCKREVAPKELMDFVAALRKEREEAWFACTHEACMESARACADILHTLLHFVALQPPEPPAPGVGENVVYSGGFEEDHRDGTPEGWAVGWLDREDRAGRAEYYRRGTHWAGHVRQGQYSLLLLWAPAAGLEWRQTWRRAIRVRPGETYECTAWVESLGEGGEAKVGLGFWDTNYAPVETATCEPISGDRAWHEVKLRATVPEGAKWMRVVLGSSLSDGAVWFDEVSVARAAE